jgi:hypothetical protein
MKGEGSSTLSGDTGRRQAAKQSIRLLLHRGGVVFRRAILFSCRKLPIDSFLSTCVSKGTFSVLADNKQKQRPKPLRLVLLDTTNEEDKANQFVTEIKKLTQTRGYQYKNIAIRYPS